MFRWSDYIFIPSDIKFRDPLKMLIRMMLRATGKDWTGVFILIMVVSALLALTELPFYSVVLWSFAIALFYWNLDARISIGAALVGLVLIPLLILSEDIGFGLGEFWAEQVAVWVYFFLVIGVLKQGWDLIRSRS